MIDRSSQFRLSLWALGALLCLAGATLPRGLAGLRDAMTSKITATPVNTGQAGQERLRQWLINPL